MGKIRISTDNFQMTATLNDSPTAAKLLDALPIESTTRLWGKEVYFEVPFHADEEDAQAEVPPGTVAFWPAGDCLCLFYGQRPASPVNVVGTLDGDPNELARIPAGTKIRVEATE